MSRGSVGAMCAVLSLSLVASSLPSTPASASSTATTNNAPVLSRPDAVSAVLTARSQNSRVEILSDDTVTSTTYANPDGTFTTESSSSPIRLLNASSHWVPISTAMSTGPAGVQVSGANPLNLTLAPVSGGTSPLVRVNPSGTPFTMSPLGAAVGPPGSTLLMPGVLATIAAAGSVAPAIVQALSSVPAVIGQDVPVSTIVNGGATSLGVGNEAIYANAIGNSALTYQLGPSALTESIVVPSLADARSGDWRFLITAPGYTPTVNADGVITFTGDKGTTPIYIPQSIASDGAANPSTTKVHATLLALGVAGTWLLDTRVDPAWLHSPSRVFPIVVDPSISVTRPPGWNYRSDGTTSSITYGNGATAGNPTSGSSNYWRAIPAFSTSGFAGTHIDSASVTLNLNGGSTNCYNVAAHAPSTGSYAGAGYGAALSSIGMCSGSATMANTAALTSWIQNNDSGSSIELGLTGGETSSAVTLKDIYPVLNVTYDTPPSTPAIVGTSSSTCPLATAPPSTAYVNTAQPTLCATSNDPDPGANLTFNFNIQTIAGANVTSFTSSSVSSGSVVAAQVPTALPEGSYMWQSRASNGTSLSAWSRWNTFVVDLTPPTSGIACASSSPVITQTGQTIDESQVPAGGVVLQCTFTGQDANFDTTGSYTYQVNANTPTTIAASGTPANDFATTFSYTVPSGSSGEGLTAISVYGNDLALNTNAANAATFTLDVGYGMSQPFANAAATATIPISAVAPSGTSSTTTAEVCWAPVATPVPTNTCGTGWTNVSGNVTVAATGASWTSSASGPVVTSPTGSGVITPIPASGYTNPYDAPSLLLNVAAAAIAAPQVINVEVCFTTSGTTTCAPAQPVDVLAHGYGNAMATSQVGPGTLSLSSGEYSMTRQDASMQGYYDSTSLAATYSSMPRATENHSALGPDWSMNVPASQGLGDYTVTDSSMGGTIQGSVILSSVNGSQFQFNVVSPGTKPQLAPVGDAQQSSLTATMSQTIALVGAHLTCRLVIVVKSPTLAVTTWNSTNLESTCDDSSVNSFYLASVTEPQSSSTSVNTWFQNTSGQPTEIIASMPSSSNCGTTLFTVPVTLSSAYKGCRVLSFQYATSTTATATMRTGTTGYGSYGTATVGNLSEVDLTQWDSNASSGSGAMVTMAVRCYLYDAGGYLREVWDPRVGLNEGATPSCSSTPLLATFYSYTASAPNAASPTTYPLASVTVPGSNAWSFAYDSAGRLTGVSTTLDVTDSNGSTTATTTVVYAVPVAGGGSTGLPDLSSPSKWSQTVDVPVSGVAVFAPDYVPGGAPGSSDWPHASITYLDGYGRQVDQASYGNGAWTGSATGAGWLVSAQQYGQQLGASANNVFQSQSNVVWSLAPTGFELAQAAGSSASTATAQQEATLNFYNTTTANGVPLGAELTDSYGPVHSVATSAGSLSARSHTNNTYGLDTPATYAASTGGASFTTNPFGQPWQLVTSTVAGYSTTGDPSALATSAMASDFGATSLPDYRATTYSYASPGANYGSPLSFATPSSTTTTVAGSSTVSRTSYLTPLGQLALTSQPLSSGNDQGTTITSYYAGTGSGACNAAPQWAGLVCGTSPGTTAPSIGSAVATTVLTYNFLLEPQSATKSVGATTERTTTNAYDLAGRPTATSVTDASGLSDIAVPDLVTTYSPSSGQATSSAYVSGDTMANGSLTNAGTITSQVQRAYDANGRLSSFADSSGATTTYVYNVDSQVAQVHEPVTGVTGGMSICTSYAGTDALAQSEQRPLPTAQSVFVGSSCSGASPATYAAAYDANGNATTLNYPNGMVATTTYNPDGQATQLAYTAGGTGVTSGYGSTVMTFAQTYNPFAQVATASSPQSNQVFAYDGLGRLTGVGDNFEGSCTTRVYTLDGDSNRTAYLSAATTPSAGSCPTTTTGSATSTSTFDTTGSGQGGSDRIISSTWGSATGTYSYDALGRQLSVPSVDTSAGGSTSPGAITTTYRADDLTNSVSQGSSCRTYSYDPLGNVVSSNSLASSCTGTPSLTTTNYYAGSSAPAWTNNGNGTVTSYFGGLTQGNALNVVTGTTASPSCLGLATASCTLNLSDLRGNIVATASITTGSTAVTGYSEQTEFGLPRSQTVQDAVAPNYGWLGTNQKAENNPSGLVVMGVRMYNPTTGLFLQSDAVLGGNDGPYVYPSDPVNSADPSGMCWFCSLFHTVTNVLATVANPYHLVEATGNFIIHHPIASLLIVTGIAVAVASGGFASVIFPMLASEIIGADVSAFSAGTMFAHIGIIMAVPLSSAAAGVLSFIVGLRLAISSTRMLKTRR